MNTTHSSTHSSTSVGAHAGHVDYLNEEKGIWSWLTTLDHKRIGVMYLWTTLLFFVVGGLFALAIRMEHWTPTKTIMESDTYNKVFTLHGAIMVFMFIIPAIPAALGNFLLPLMIGAKDVAFPRLNLASYYVYIVGALMALAAIILGSGVDTGWTFYTPYSIRTGTSVVLVVMSVFVMGFSSIFTGINFIATIHKLRAPGMTFHRMPLFIWAQYATSIIQVLATPVIGITMVLLAMERVFKIGIFDAKLGGDPILFQHFFWFYSHPAVYIMILPGMGIISELITTFSRKVIFGYSAIAYSSLAIAAISFLVWGHHMFVSGQSDFSNFVFSFLTFLVAVPTAVKIFNWTATLYKGKITITTPMLYALTFIFLFSIGGLTGLFLGSLSTDVHLTDTYFIVAHFHYVMMGGTVMALLGGFHYWWPKIFGRMYNEAGAKFAWFFVFVGFNLLFLPQFWMGSHGMPRRYYNYPAQFEIAHKLSTVGAFLTAFGLFVHFAILIYAAKKGPKVTVNNPWDAKTLEWTVECPPTLHNFHSQPIVTEPPYNYQPENV